MITRRKYQQSGFTLVEVLVSLFIFSILSASTLTVLTSTLRSKDAVQNKSNLVQKRAVMRVLMKSDFAQTLPLMIAKNFDQNEHIYFVGGDMGEDVLFALSRTGWDNPGGVEPRSNLQAVEYVLRDDTLVRRIYARFNPAESTPIYEQILLGDIEQAKASFFDGRDWRDTWVMGRAPIGAQELPKLVSLELIFKNNETIQQIFYLGADQ